MHSLKLLLGELAPASLGWSCVSLTSLSQAVLQHFVSGLLHHVPQTLACVPDQAGWEVIIMMMMIINDTSSSLLGNVLIK